MVSLEAMWGRCECASTRRITNSIQLSFVEAKRDNDFIFSSVRYYTMANFFLRQFSISRFRHMPAYSDSHQHENFMFSILFMLKSTIWRYGFEHPQQVHNDNDNVYVECMTELSHLTHRVLFFVRSKHRNNKCTNIST